MPPDADSDKVPSVIGVLGSHPLVIRT